MKKVLAMFLVCAMALSLSAKSKSTLLFNRPQFQTSKAGCALEDLPALTVPFVYSGTLALDGKIAWDDDDAIYEKNQAQFATICGDAWDGASKHWGGVGVDGGAYYCYVADYSAKLPVYMTLCQPCIDCYPCTVLGQYDGLTWLVNDETQADAVGFNNAAFVGKITRWNLYILEVNKKEAWVDIYKVNLLDEGVNPDSALNSVFFTGGFKNAKSASSKAQSGGKAYVQVKGDDFGSLAMTGVKNDYKFKYTDAYLLDDLTWVATGNGSATAYIKSVSKFDGLYCLSRMFSWDANGEYLFGYQFCGAISLTRNASLTKAAVTKTFSATVTASSGKNWEDCFVDTPADFCEMYFANNVWGDQFDNYLEGTAYKKYDVWHSTAYFFDEAISEIIDFTVGSDEIDLTEDETPYEYAYGDSESSDDDDDDTGSDWE